MSILIFENVIFSSIIRHFLPEILVCNNNTCKLVQPNEFAAVSQGTINLMFLKYMIHNNIALKCYLR